jgi:UPF0755 protein
LKNNIINIKDKGGISENEIYFISSAFGFIFGLLLFIFYAPNYNKNNSSYQFEIKQGSPLTVVIDSLYEKKIIPNKTFMRVAAFFYSAEKKVKAGKYNIPNGLNYFQLVEILIDGTPAEQKRLTIPEGIWQFKLASLISKEFNLDSAKIMELSEDKEFLTTIGIEAKSAEGYLLPETYYFYDDNNEREIITKLKMEMDKIFETQSVIDQMQKMDMTKHQILTLASIIDGESNVVSEFKRISGVYHNRLNKNMLLQADPTVQYLIRHRNKKNKVYFKDLEIVSPYNTYLYAGLPPGPINNPGKEAIMAAIFPEKNDYIFFVADGNGGHVFSKSLSDHNKNVSNYRRWRNSQK